MIGQLSWTSRKHSNLVMNIQLNHLDLPVSPRGIEQIIQYHPLLYNRYFWTNGS